VSGSVNELIHWDAVRLSEGLRAKVVSAEEVTRAHLDRIDAVDGPTSGPNEHGVHAFLHVDHEGALARARRIDADRAAGAELGPLAGVPIGVKDVLTTKGLPTTCGSRMLEGWVPPYDATVVRELHAAGLVVLGKTNMDEFAMGSTTEHSAFGDTRNPWDPTRIPGGSGGGSAAALAAFEAPLTVGSDTGGSIRQPAALTGTVGVKPTYGAVSRYGLVALASSLDQAGPCARTVMDTALLHAVIAGHDPYDSTSIPAAVPDLSGEGYEAGVLARFEESLTELRAAGAEVVEVSLPNIVHALAAYYLILPSEASSNLAKFDGMRYGLRVVPEGEHVTAETVMRATRAAGFGDEAKRRIILGTYALSAGYYDAYYGSAQKVRTLVQRDFDAAFGTVDVLVSPTAPTVAYRLGEKLDDPLAMYAGDVATIPANLAGIPGMSLPAGLSDGLPVGVQVLAPQQADDRLYRVGAALEARLVDKWGGPLLAQVPTWQGVSA
jgi:aspartyl-tRNA(Asn)/glutamyl-tRNA(Gln) amidotransferase subunit A